MVGACHRRPLRRDDDGRAEEAGGTGQAAQGVRLGTARPESALARKLTATHPDLGLRALTLCCPRRLVERLLARQQQPPPTRRLQERRREVRVLLLDLDACGFAVAESAPMLDHDRRRHEGKGDGRRSEAPPSLLPVLVRPPAALVRLHAGALRRRRAGGHCRRRPDRQVRGDNGE